MKSTIDRPQTQWPWLPPPVSLSSAPTPPCSPGGPPRASTWHGRGGLVVDEDTTRTRSGCHPRFELARLYEKTREPHGGHLLSGVVPMSTTTRWFGPISGLLAVVLVIVSQGMGDADAEPSDSVNTIMTELSGSADGATVAMLGAGFLAIYIGHLRTRFQEQGAGWAASVLSAGGVVVVAAALIVVGAQLTGAEAADQGHVEVAQGVVDFTWSYVWLFTPGLLAFGVGAATASFSQKVLPVWLGAFGVLVGVSAIAPWIGLGLFGLWVLAASIDELVRVIREPSAPGTLDPAATSNT